MAAATSIELAAEGAKHPDVFEFLKRPARNLLINGKWVPAKSGKTFEVINPANEFVLATVAEGDKADVDEAVKAARKAFEEGPWPRMSPHARTRILLKFADLISLHAAELAELVSLEGGKPLVEAQGEVGAAAAQFIYYGGWITKIYGETNPSAPEMFNYTLREPVGVCGQITPWNGPIAVVAMKWAPALACGNTVILKPAEQTPLTAVRMGELALEAGIPEGVINIVTGFGETAGAAIASHPDIDKVAFTGSTAVGKEIVKASAGNLKRVSLELGGKSPNIIFSDANMESAVRGSAAGIFANQGEVCCAASRMFVQEKIYEKFAEGLVNSANKIRLGNPFDPHTTMGPLVSKEQHERVLGYLSAGKQEGAKARVGGDRGPQERGYFVQPTVFTEVNNGMKIAQEEIFGPVASVIRFKDENDAVLQGNDTTYGLAAAVWTRDISRAHAVARKLKAGTVWINCYMAMDPISPFGGYKQSGFGRELGPWGIEEYLETKQVHINLNEQPIGWY
jgi:acyl-CoA reductase-like NAD-dependent aldehyde dehydrogenase